MQEADADSLAHLVSLLQLPRHERVLEARPQFSKVEAPWWIRGYHRSRCAAPLLRAKFPVRCHPNWISGKIAFEAPRLVNLRHEAMEHQPGKRAQAAPPKCIARHRERGQPVRSPQCAKKLSQFYERAATHQICREVRRHG